MLKLRDGLGFSNHSDLNSPWGYALAGVLWLDGTAVSLRKKECQGAGESSQRTQHSSAISWLGRSSNPVQHVDMISLIYNINQSLSWKNYNFNVFFKICFNSLEAKVIHKNHIADASVSLAPTPSDVAAGDGTSAGKSAEVGVVPCLQSFMMSYGYPLVN